MKKKIIVAAVAAIVALGAAWNLNQKKDNNAISDLTLSNVEALASESGMSIYCNCLGCGRQICPIDGKQYYQVAITYSHWG